MPRPFSSRRHRRLVLWFLGLVALVATGCESAIDVLIEVEEDGSGIVRVDAVLDGDTTGAILDLETVGLAVGDLEAGGWATEPPVFLESGGLQLTASKEFGTPEQMTEVLEEITGDASLLARMELSRVKGFARVDYELTGSIEPNGLEPFGDAELTAALGRSLESIAARYGASADDVTVTLRVQLPGDPRDAETATGEIPPNAVGTIREWSTTLSADSSTEVRIASTTTTVAALVWRGVAIVAAVLAALVLLGQILRVLRPQTRRSRGRPVQKARPKPRPAPVVPAEETIVDGEEIDAQPVVVALDGMGVIYKEGNDINEILVPFVREMGSDVTEDEIIARSRALSLGRMTTADFWSSLGIEGDPNELDEMYLGRHQLNPGVIKFLRALRDQGVRVACITNDATTWANRLRARHSLDGLIDPWVMSGAVGVRKPDRPIYEVLRRVTGEPPARIMIVDDDLQNLDAAREFGFRTAWFRPGASITEANGHAILRSFEVSTPDQNAAEGAANASTSTP